MATSSSFLESLERSSRMQRQAMEHAMAANVLSGLGGLGSLGATGQAAAGQLRPGACIPVGAFGAIADPPIKHKPIKRFSSLREELQRETDEWLKDV